MIQWEDVSSYSRSDADRTPNWWSTQVGCFPMSVGNSHIDYRDDPKWLMTFNHGRNEVLGDKDEFTAEQAKARALDIVKRRLQTAVEEIDFYKT